MAWRRCLAAIQGRHPWVAGVSEALVRPVFHMEQTGRKGLTVWGVAHPDQAALRVQAGNEQLFHMKHIHP